MRNLDSILATTAFPDTYPSSCGEKHVQSIWLRSSFSALSMFPIKGPQFAESHRLRPLAMNFVNSVCQLLCCGPASLYENLQNLTENSLALFIVLEQRALIREVAAHNPENNILR